MSYDVDAILNRAAPGGGGGGRNCIPKRDTYAYAISDSTATLHDYLPRAKALGNYIKYPMQR